MKKLLAMSLLFLMVYVGFNLTGYAEPSYGQHFKEYLEPGPLNPDGVRVVGEPTTDYWIYRYSPAYYKRGHKK